MISAGRVLPMPKGDYNALTTYEFLDIVSDNGNSYILKVDTSTGNPPTDTTKWQLLAYGGSAANVAANFAVVEATQYASQAYKVGDFLVDKDSKLCRVTAAILQGSEIIIGTNVEVTSVTALVRTVEESIAVVETKIASYSHDIGDHFYLSDVLYKATAAIQAGDTLTSGTNITPAVDVCTQINELASDTETAIQGVKDLLAPSEDGSTAVLSYSIGDEFIRNGALCKAKTAITSGDTLVLNTNYEDAGVAMDQLVSLNQTLTNQLTDEVTTRAKTGVHNFCTQTFAKGNYTSNGFVSNDYVASSKGFALKAGTYILSWTELADHPASILGNYLNTMADETHSTGPNINLGSGNPMTITVPNDGIYAVQINVKSAGTNPAYSDAEIATLNSSLVLKLETDAYNTYQPYAMTNRELTETLTTKSSQAISTYLTAKRYGKVVNIQGYISVANSDLTVGTDYQIGTLNSEFRPSSAFSVPVTVTAYSGTTLDYKPARFYVGANGVLVVNPAELSALTTTTFQINCTYLVD